MTNTEHGGSRATPNTHKYKGENQAKPYRDRKYGAGSARQTLLSVVRGMMRDETKDA